MFFLERAFWEATLERAVTTAAQGVGFVLVGAGPADLYTLDWGKVLGGAALGFLLAVVTSLAKAQLGPNKGSPAAFGPETVKPVPVAPEPPPASRSRAKRPAAP